MGFYTNYGVRLVKQLYKEGLSYEEISTELGCDIGFVIAIMETED